MTNDKSYFNSNVRLRRLRKTAAIREMICETQLSVKDLVWPLFIQEGQNKKQEVSSLPGVFKLSVDNLVAQAKVAQDLGVPALALFPVVPDNKKNSMATESKNEKRLNANSYTGGKKPLSRALFIFRRSHGTPTLTRAMTGL